MYSLQLHKQAQECLTMLSNRLGDREYFFGRTPSTIDAIIFSYLTLLLKVSYCHYKLTLINLVIIKILSLN